MAHAWHHAESSARRFGGDPAIYMVIHDFLDASKIAFAAPAHRALRHSAFGCSEAEERFGPTIDNGAGRRVPVRMIAERHIVEDLGRVPSVQDWLAALPLRLPAGTTLEEATIDGEPAAVRRDGAQPVRIRREPAARQRLQRARQRAARVRHRHTDGSGPEVQPDQRGVAPDQGGQRDGALQHRRSRPRRRLSRLARRGAHGAAAPACRAVSSSIRKR
jgi:hypothetical protein